MRQLNLKRLDSPYLIFRNFPVKSSEEITWKMLLQLEQKLGYKIINWDEKSKEDIKGSWVALLSLSSKNILKLGKSTLYLEKNSMTLFPNSNWKIQSSIQEPNKTLLYYELEIYNIPLSVNYFHILVRQLTYRIEDCLSYKLCEEIIDTAETSKWTTQRHDNFPTTDIPLKDLPRVDAKVRSDLKRKIFPWMEEWFFLPSRDMYFKDLFVVKYSVQGQKQLNMHRDTSLLSFNVLLNDSKDFEGGGTYFFKTKKHVTIEKGQAVMHSGALYHSGRPVTKGVRYILVGFVGLRGDSSKRINMKLRDELFKRSVTDEEYLYNVFLY